jgi:hypothetical protein
MKNLSTLQAPSPSPAPLPSGIRRARVLSSRSTTSKVSFTKIISGAPENADARHVLGVAGPITVGHEVLVCEAEGEHFILAALTPGVALVDDEHQPEADEPAQLSRRGDDLVLCAPKGRIVIEAAEGIEMRSELDMKMESKHSLHLRAGSDEEGAGLDLNEAGWLATGAALVGVFGDAQLKARRAEIAAGLIEIGAERVKSKIGRLQVDARRLVERTQSTFRESEDLYQVRAGRVRWAAERTLHALGEWTLIKARKDVKVKGRKIHLG